MADLIGHPRHPRLDRGSLQGIAQLSPDSTMKILIDNGHGIQTKGKRSPDGQLLEYAYTRELERANRYDEDHLILCIQKS